MDLLNLRLSSRPTIKKAINKAPAIGVLLALTMIMAGCQAAGSDTLGQGNRPDELAFADEDVTTTTVLETTISTTTTTAPIDVPLGSKATPFLPLAPETQDRAIITETGVVLPVIKRVDESWLIVTPCSDVKFVSNAKPLGRAHVVLDAGHGGVEPGAVGPEGTREKDLNLAVTLRTQELLEAAGATVVLTRTGDYEITTTARGLIAEAVDPALFVSVHHNGGAPPSGDKPGTIVFTKGDSDESTRFGGVFYETLQPVLDAAAETKRLDYQVYADALDAHDALVAAYDQSVAARDGALVANGQVPPEVTTTIPSTTTTVEPGGVRLPQQRELATTTTVPPTAEITVPVPETLPPPPTFTLDPVREFKWAGQGNGGVRSWMRPDGRDYLSVLRTSGEVPAALVEFLYVTNPSEEELLMEPAFVEAEAKALAESIVLYFSSTDQKGSGHVKDQFGDQSIGGSGGARGCVEPKLDFYDEEADSVATEQVETQGAADSEANPGDDIVEGDGANEDSAS